MMQPFLGLQVLFLFLIFSNFILLMCNATANSHQNVDVEIGWNLFGIPGDGYYINAQIGTPPQNINLLIDTGSSNLAVAGPIHIEDHSLDTYFDPNKSSTFISLKKTQVKVVYSDSWWEGALARDMVFIPNLNLVSPLKVDFALIEKSHSFYVNGSHWQGILGLAFPELSKPNKTVQPWFDRLISLRNKKDDFPVLDLSPIEIGNVTGLKTSPSKHLKDDNISAAKTDVEEFDILNDVESSELISKSSNLVEYSTEANRNASINQETKSENIDSSALNSTKKSDYVIAYEEQIKIRKLGRIQNCFGLELCGPRKVDQEFNHRGKFYIGNEVNSCGHGNWYEAPILRPWYYELAIVDIYVNDVSLDQPCASYNYNVSSVDSGTSFLGLPEKVFEAVERELNLVAVEKLPEQLPVDFWRGEGVVCWSEDHIGWSMLPNITLEIANSNKTTFTITLGPRSYLSISPKTSTKGIRYSMQFSDYGDLSSERVPKAELLRNNSSNCYISGIGPSKHLGTILGVSVLQGLCVKFDRSKGVIGFRKGSCTPNVNLSGPRKRYDAGSCVRHHPSDGTTGTIVLAFLLALLCCPLLFHITKYIITLIKKKNSADSTILDMDETAALA